MIHFLNILATWRLSRLLMQERGPYAILDKTREYISDKRYEAVQEATNNSRGFGAISVEGSSIWYELSEMVSCEWCLSIWIGFAVAIVTRQNILYGFAYSAGALMFGRIFEKLGD